MCLTEELLPPCQPVTSRAKESASEQPVTITRWSYAGWNVLLCICTAVRNPWDAPFECGFRMLPAASWFPRFHFDGMFHRLYLSVTGFRCHFGMFSSLVIDTEDFYIHGLFPVSVLSGAANKWWSEALGRSIFSPTLSLLASFGTVHLFKRNRMAPGGLRRQRQQSIFPYVWLSDAQALDLCPHGHVYEKSLVWGRDVRCTEAVCVKWGFICMRSVFYLFGALIPSVT